MNETMQELFGDETNIQLVLSRDGSGVGAAIIAAIAAKREH